MQTTKWILAMAAMSGLCAACATAQEVPTTKPPDKPSIKPPEAISPDWKRPGVGGDKSGGQLVSVRGAADVDAIVPGQKFLLAFVFKIEPGWHIYWKDSGDSGAPTEIEIAAPAGFVVGKTLFPRPQRFTEPEGEVYGYEGETVLFVEMTPPMEPAPSGPAMFRAELNWLVCKDVCKVGHAADVVTLPVSNSSARPDHKKDATVERFKNRLPQMLANGQNDAVVELKDGVLRVELPAGGRTAAEFFAVETPGVEYGTPDIKVETDRVVLKVPVEFNVRNANGKSIAVKGLVAIGASPDDPCYEFEFPLPAS